jgi:hypothetical protein
LIETYFVYYLTTDELTKMALETLMKTELQCLDIAERQHKHEIRNLKVNTTMKLNSRDEGIKKDAISNKQTRDEKD